MIDETIFNSATTQMINSLVGKVIAPRFEKFIKSIKTDYKEILDKNKDYFGEYYRRTYEKYSYVNTLVFRNSQCLLKDIYVAQTLVKENRFGGKAETAKIDRMPKELLIKYKRILITDTAGMGKSTLLKRMFIDLIENGIEGIGIPVYIELNRLNRKRTILQEIYEELYPTLTLFDEDMLLKFIQVGGFTFFLDGYDEISIADRSEVTSDIQSFILKAGIGNYFLLTSRPESGLSSFGDFQSFKIKPFSKEEAFELLKKYDLSKKKELSRKLVDLLQSGEYYSIDEYLMNPLLVSLLYTAFDYKQTIPLKKHLFYKQVYEAYFDSHDLSKGIEPHQKRSGLDIDDFNRVLKYIGYECLIRIGVQFDRDTIISSIEKAKSFCGNLDFDNNDFLFDLLISVPLFSKDGLEYKWTHITLMEYFAARFIAEDAKEYQDGILTAMYESENLEKYINMLDIYYDIDFKGFSKNIIYRLCNNFIRFYNDNYYISNIGTDLIKERISILFLNQTAFWISSYDGQSSPNACNFCYEKPLGFDYVDQIGIQGIDNERVFFAVIKPTKNYHLAELLYRKNTSFISVSGSAHNEYHQLRVIGMPEEICKFEHDKVHVINSKTGEQSPELYKGINLMLTQYFKALLDYEACNMVVKKILKEIVLSDDISDLLVGI